MKNIAIISYNIHCYFTNYGSALQSWALNQTIKKLGYRPILVDYCLDCLKDKNPLKPMDNMWDEDGESRRMCELSLLAIQKNYDKFEQFYTTKFNRTKKVYTRENFDDIVADEKVDGFVCGSDTIFCVDEFGIDDGYYANCPVMKNGYTIAYAASFGDSHFTEQTYKVLNERLNNFKALAIREKWMIPYIKEHTQIPVQKVLDPTLLLTRKDYDTIAIDEQLENEKYLLLYARRYDKSMFDYADRVAQKRGLKVIDISLRATNADRHRMFYEAGVEEFLSLVKYADYVVTKSFHGMIVAVHYNRPFVIFSREQCDIKIDEVLDLFGLQNRKMQYQDPWKKQARSKKRIIYAPHHTISSKYKDGLALSTFLENADVMLEMMHKYSDRVQWAFKPHPLLYRNLLSVWGQENTDKYYNEWKNADNSQFEDGEYDALFKYSDAMIYDCSSFTIEYLYTKNPVMFLVRQNGGSNPHNAFSQKADELHQKGLTKADIDSFILDVINGIDPLKEEKEKFYNDSLTPPNGKTACENIINSILGE